MNDYWKKRQEEKLFNILKNADITADYIAEIYQKSSLYLNNKIQGIFDKYRAKNGLSIQEAKLLLNSLEQGHKYDELLQKLRSGVSSKERKELLKKLDAPAYAYRIKMLQEAQNDIDLLMNTIYNQEKEISTLSYIKSAYDGYYKDVFNIQKDINVAYQFNKLNPREVNVFLKSRWSGKNYSERIWNNTQELADSLKDEMMIGVLTGKTEKEMADTIAERFQVGAYQSRRLIRTEVAAVASFIDQEAFEDAGIEFEMFIAVHDGKTSKICQKHDRSVVEVGKGEIGKDIPPLHPNCRSVMIPYFEGITENMKKRQRNPITGEDEIINVNETYDQWLKRQQKNGFVQSKSLFMEDVLRGRMKSNNRKLDYVPDIFNFSSQKESNLINIYADIDRKFLKDGFEHMAIADGETGLLLKPVISNGSKKSVVPDDETLKFIIESEEKSLTLIHNHPKGTPFSITDIITTNEIKSIKESIVINSNGEVYFLSIPLGKEINLSSDKLIEKFKDDIIKQREECQKEYPNISNKDISHLAYLIFFERLGWNYGRKRF